MPNPIYDHDKNEILYQINDDYALKDDGTIVMRSGDHWGFDTGTGEFHTISGWESSHSDSSSPYGYSCGDDPSDADDDDDDSVYTAAASGANKNPASGTGSSYQPGQTQENNISTMDAAIITGGSLFVAAAIACLIGGEHAVVLGIVLWPITAISIALLKLRRK